MDLQKLIDSLVPALGHAGVQALTDKLSGLKADASDPWKKAVLGMAVSAVQAHGTQGIDLAHQYLDALIAGKAPPVIDGLDLEAVSDLLAQIENAEADKKTACKAYLTQIGDVLGTILSAIAKGIISSM